MESDVVGAVWERMSDPDIALSIALIEKRVLRTLNLLHLARGAALNRALGLVLRAVDAVVGGTADVDGPDEARLDGLRLDGLYLVRGRRAVIRLTGK